MLWALFAVAAVVLVVLGGFLVPPGEMAGPAEQESPSSLKRVPVPEGLPAPVDEWLRTAYPGGVPVADTIVMRGTGHMRIGPLPVPMRHRVEIRPGEGFVRRMDLTWYGLAFARGKDTFVRGRGFMSTPVGDFEGDKIDQGADVVNWLETLAAPGVLLTNPEVQWEAVDAHSAQLSYPHDGGRDELTLYFNAVSKLPVRATAMRYKDAGPEAMKLEWTARMRDHETLGGVPVATEIDATWQGARRPWATFDYTDVWVNVGIPEMQAAESTAGQVKR